MTTLNYTVKFHKTVLASFIGLCISQSCFALEAMSDEKLGDTTGEGIALLPQNAYMVFRGAGPNETSEQLLDRTKDIGYINYVPVGPLSTTAIDTNKNGAVDSADQAVGKADLFLYGLAVSKANDLDPNDSNERVGMIKDAAGKATAINGIKSWGTASNPWILKVANDPLVPTFTPDPAGGKNTDTGSVAYLSLEAPAFETGALDAAGSDAYKLKLGLWADAFVRNPNKAEGDPNQFVYGTDKGLVGTGSDSVASRANRVRLQAIWNNFGLNGSKIQLFQTLNGAGSTGGMSPFYNNTLGLAGVIRLNSGDSSNLKASVTNNGTTTIEDPNWTARYSPSTTSTPTDTGVEEYRIRSQTTKLVSTSSWKAPDALALSKVMRLSTQEAADTNNLYTPALDTTGGAKAPTFAKNEGIFIYNLNTNLVLGSLYQPLILGSDGKNFSLEIARIPNKESIYKKIYTDYTGADKTYLGSTCNVYQCGSGITGYQGNNATHSSISIGTVFSPDGGKTLQAFKGDATSDAVGISFGKLTADPYVTSQTRYFYQLQNQYRKSVSCTGFLCNGYRWEYRTANGTQTSGNRQYDLRFDSLGANWSNIQDTGLYNPTIVNSGYSRPDVNNTAFTVPTTQPLPDAMYENGRWISTTVPTDTSIYRPNAPSAINNLGSAVIDGMLIQHMKITTKGL